ncbi:cell division protein FtsQ/DivIB [Culicoidibacter larvae]|uniref:FtsQ-type POTRA domain-containing protein n=1 Tax=Culicoidibacter larvae TaxID=2579976 RepID=A0A5R8Q9Q5_9FIRM|nr:FtsQ-type POTRA domain-containing protein [Culicoidibacter larvae]TLG72143.1 FtsQ-type POTRA domain-containing protein [Culicoidibacter larvae]
MRQKQAKEKTLKQLVDNGDERIEVFEARKNAKKRKRKIRKRVFVVLILLVVGIVGFLISPLAGISTITVSGNQYLSAAQIRELAGITEGSNFYFNPGFIIANRVEGSPIVNHATVTQNFGNRVEIVVEEFKPLFWYSDKDGQKHIVITDQDGEKLLCTTDSTDASQENSESQNNAESQTTTNTESVPNKKDCLTEEEKTNRIVQDIVVENEFNTNGIPLATNLTEQQIVDLSQAMSFVPESTREMISEINGTPTELDPNLLTLYMNDRNIVELEINKVAKSLRNYKSIVDKMNGQRIKIKFLDKIALTSQI